MMGSVETGESSPAKAPPPSESLVVLSTVGTSDDAERIARSLVESRLAACVNVLPGLTSIYRFEGAVERDAEVLLLIKTRRDTFEALRQALVAMHPYAVPEVVALRVEAVHEPYRAWLDENVRPHSPTVSPRDTGQRGGPSRRPRPDSR